MSEKNESEVTEVGEIDLSKKTSPILDKDAMEKSGTKANGCYYNGAFYGHGSRVSMGGRVYKCSNGNWIA